jgi:chromosomal replication initiation ATPase DnaA
MIDDIIETACVVFDLPRAAILGPSRAKHISEARQAVIYALARRTRLSQVEIARVLGRSDHTTVQHALKVVERRCTHDADYRAMVNAVLDVPGPRPATPPPPPTRRIDPVIWWALASYGGFEPRLKAA